MKKIKDWRLIEGQIEEFQHQRPKHKRHVSSGTEIKQITTQFERNWKFWWLIGFKLHNLETKDQSAKDA